MYIFKFNEAENYFEVLIDGNTICIDVKFLELLYRNPKTKNMKWNFDENNNIYALDTNNKIFYLVELLYKIPYSEYNWTFKNNNKFDVTVKNVTYSSRKKTKEMNKLPDTLEIIKSFDGHVPKLGKSAGKVLNPYWLVKLKNPSADEQEKEFYAMYCEVDSICYFSKESLDKILFSEQTGDVPTWFLVHNGYIASHYHINKMRTMHQVVMNRFDKDDAKNSIDHINRNKPDNRLSNLRITTQSEQNKNKDKQARQKNACELPAGLKQSDMPKLLYYQKEYLNKETGRYRDYFVIDRHPGLLKDGKKRWTTKKSMKLTTQQKLDEALNKIKELDQL